VRTINTVIALNFGVIAISELIETVPVYADIVASEVNLPGKYYIDPYYAPMKAIFCIDKANPTYELSAAAIAGPEICFLSIFGAGASRTMLVYPVINQLSSNFQPCTCPKYKTDFGCNSQTFLYTLVQPNDFNSSVMVDLGTRMQKLMIDDPINGDIQIMESVAEISRVSIFMAAKGKIDPGSNIAGISTPLFYEQLNGYLQQLWDDYCPGCSAVVFFSYGTNANRAFLPVNKYDLQFASLSNESTTYKVEIYVNDTTSIQRHFELPLMMCENTLSQMAAMAKLTATSPVPLVADYFECQNTLQAAALTGIGSAAGSAGLYTSIVATVVGLIFVKYINSRYGKQVGDVKLDLLLSTELKSQIAKAKEVRKHEALMQFFDEIGKSLGNVSPALKEKLDYLKAFEAPPEEPSELAKEAPGAVRRASHLSLARTYLAENAATTKAETNAAAYLGPARSGGRPSIQSATFNGFAENPIIGMTKKA